MKTSKMTQTERMIENTKVMVKIVSAIVENSDLTEWSLAWIAGTNRTPEGIVMAFKGLPVDVRDNPIVKLLFSAVVSAYVAETSKPKDTEPRKRFRYRRNKLVEKIGESLTKD